MKKLLLLLSLLLLVTGTSALALSFTDVGGFDLYKASGDIAPSGELAWIASIYNLDPDDLTFTKWAADKNTDPQWQAATDPNVGEIPIYIDFRAGGASAADDPFAFLIKAASDGALIFDDEDDGIEATPGVSTILFDNLAKTQYGVIDQNWIEKVRGNFEIETISHTSFTSGGGIPPQSVVPEPSTLVLLGAGLIGLAAYRRKKG